MNIQGVSHYSSSTAAMRQTSGNRNSHLRLVYVYPMLFDDSLTKYQDLFRSFLAATMIKEIFISNALHIVSMSSHYNMPTMDMSSIIGDAVSGYKQPQQQTFNLVQPRPVVSQYELQNKVLQKTEVIRRLINIDPVISKLKPMVDMITLENLMEVPVITGTKAFSSKSIQLLYVLLAAIGKDKPLNSVENLNSIISDLTTLNDKTIHTLLNNSVKGANEENAVSFFQRIFGGVSFRQYLRMIYNLTPPVNTTTVTQLKDQGRSNIPGMKSNRIENTTGDNVKKDKLEHYDQMFNILKVQKNQLDELTLNFKFMLDPKMLESQTGLQFGNRIQETITQINPHLQLLMEEMLNNFIGMVSSIGTPILNTFSMLIRPINNVDISFLNIKKFEIDTELNNNINTFVKDPFTKRIESRLNQTSSDSVLKLLDKLCSGVMKDIDSDVIKLLKYDHQQLSFQPYPDPSDPNYVDNLNRINLANSRELETWLTYISKLAALTDTINAKLMSNINLLLDDSKLLLSVRVQIATSINNFINYHINNTNGQPAFGIYIGAISVENYTKFRQQMYEILLNLFYFMFLYNVAIMLCKYVKIADVAISVTRKDALDYPNYSLVIPLDIIYLLHSAYFAKRWDDLVHNSMNVAEVNPNENYVKGMVKFICKKLDVPNLFVVDTFKNDVYYKLMHHDAVQKTKLNTIETFTEQIMQQRF